MKKVQLEGAPMNLPWASALTTCTPSENVEQAAASQHRDQQADNEMQELCITLLSLDIMCVRGARRERLAGWAGQGTVVV
ncbi:unnamed protein product [Trichogramma brassicae]|uniref:Uncharacterized protein n=1 Tax=Trichogramma brassicae TaxID=86971 RepID=A0A6H5I1D6_9HYME|nr:unnamed protein product [Trichogramma brassicae]